MSKDEIQKVTLGTNEALRVTADGEFIWHPEADAMIEYGDFTSSPAMRHILRALRKAFATTDLQAELDATNRQVEILSDALAESRREIAALKAVQEPFGYLEIEDIESHSEYPHNCRSVSLWHEGGEGMVAIYTTPPAAQRQWVGLTEDEIDEIFNNWPTYNLDHFEFGKVVEAKVFEKNGAIAVVIPDALNPKDENPAYAAGWNDCRAEMLKGMKP
jgi:hypothetical protein